MVQKTLSNSEGSEPDDSDTDSRAETEDGERTSDVNRSSDDGNQPAGSNDSVGKSSRVSIASPRCWHGMRFLTYLRLLWNGGFRVHFLGIGMMVAAFVYSVVNSILSFTQWIVLGRKIARTKIEKPPVFIVGHWRSGTTLVHELMNLDDQLQAPNTYQCFVPCHFLISEWCIKPMVGLAMPKTRPMDNMPTGPDRPNEDEFAICALGGPSPYARMAFPNLPKPYEEQIDMVDVPEKDLKRLEKCLVSFAKTLTSGSNGRRLVLKSPTHTGRIDFLRRVFPGAKFLHICRDPKDIIPSTIRLWKRLDRVNGFQIPNYDQAEMEDYVGDTFRRMYDSFDKSTASQSDDLALIRYEDLIADPIASLGAAYSELGLDGFDQLEPKLRTYMESQAEYKKNKHQLTDRLREIINRQCASYQEKYGYAKA